MEQATLVRRAVKDPGVPPFGETMVPAPAPSREGGPSVPVELTDDELQLLAEIATGVTTDVAARRLELSARTLRRRLRAICDQLGVNTPIEAVVWAARKQLI
ncbi:LuxR C-terminal-related transcriptional regulator [Nocardiopsis gilva]